MMTPGKIISRNFIYWGISELSSVNTVKFAHANYVAKLLRNNWCQYFGFSLNNT
jgi:hypothetical protein